MSFQLPQTPPFKVGVSQFLRTLSVRAVPVKGTDKLFDVAAHGLLKDARERGRERS